MDCTNNASNRLYPDRPYPDVLGGAYAAQETQPRPETFIEMSVERIRKISESTGTLRARLMENADRVFGTIPEPSNGVDGPAQSQLIPSSLCDQLVYALNRLEEEHQRLAAAVERNCWAV